MDDGMRILANLPGAVLLAAVWAFCCAGAVATEGAPVTSDVAQLGPGDHTIRLGVAGLPRSFRVHIPPQYTSATAAPVVLVFHGAGMSAGMMEHFCALSRKADQEGFIAVYPSGTGAGRVMMSWNAGGLRGPLAKGRPDDVEFVGALLDRLAQSVRVNPKRVYATGFSNGGMMCYKLAADLSDRIAAIAPVAAAMTFHDPRPTRPVSVIHFHGLADTVVPFRGPDVHTPTIIRYLSVDETIRAWVRVNRCAERTTEESLPDRADDGTRVARRVFGGGLDGAEVVLYVIQGGGHAWPGPRSPFFLSGRSTLDISANDEMWEFFKRHPMK
jgi:polyhydroxybutyrate depolymerase